MKAMILCGGQGTRLREHTETVPKPMVDVGGKPIVWHIMKTYAHYGITDFVLCLGYKGHVIRDYFLNYETRAAADLTVTLGPGGGVTRHGEAHGEAGWTVTLADTGEATLTGGRVRRAADRFLSEGDETFCLTYGDGVCDVDVAKLIAYHRSHGGCATVTAVRPPSRFGELRHDEDGRALAFEEKPQVSSGLINGGYFVFDRSFLEYVTADASCVLESHALEQCAADGKLYVHEHAGYWQCMDTYRDWLWLNERWEKGAPWAVWR